jgi:glycosyltransferase involved in cell wall biosynthesis
MHVTMVVDNDEFGNAEAYTRRLLRFLPDWVHRSLVVSEAVAHHFPADWPVRLVPTSRHHAWAPRTRAALRELDPDVAHVNLVDPGSNLAALWAAEQTAPTVATLHGLGERSAADEVWNPYHRLTAGIAPSRTIAARLAELGVPGERVVPIRHGVEIPARGVVPRARLPVVIGACDRLASESGLDLLLQSVAALRRRARKIQVLIAGDGPDRAALIDRARGLPIRFLGRIWNSARFLRQLDVFCLPARRETLSPALLEALAHGLPCVTTATGDTMDTLAGAAMIVPPDNMDGLTAVLDRVVTDIALRHKLARDARERAARDFDVRWMTARTAAVFEEL